MSKLTVVNDGEAGNFFKSKQTTFSERDDVYKMDSVVQRAFKLEKEGWMHR